MNIKKKIGYKVNKIRIEKGFSQAHLAELSGLDRTYITDIEKGKRNISILVLEKLAKGLNIDIKVFFDNKDWVNKWIIKISLIKIHG